MVLNRFCAYFLDFRSLFCYFFIIGMLQNRNLAQLKKLLYNLTDKKK